MPYAIHNEWPPLSKQRSYGQRGVLPMIYSWPAGGKLQWSYSDVSASEAPPLPAATGSSGGSGYEAVEVLANEAVAKLAAKTSTVPVAANDTFTALRRNWVALHAMEEGLNVY